MSAPITHWGYGSGSVGCLFDSQGTAETRDDAIASALFIFETCEPPGDPDEPSFWAAIEDALKDARETLAAHSIYYFPSALRGVFGADCIEVWEEDGPRPEED